jgi:hypothetical protein
VEERSHKFCVNEKEVIIRAHTLAAHVRPWQCATNDRMLLQSIRIVIDDFSMNISVTNNLFRL